jgi:glycosyltransferase involved in cell wall biosynthesis
MQIKYITNVRLPSGRAAGYAIMKMCSEFAKAGSDMELFVPKRGNNSNKEDPFDFYKIERNFQIKKIPSLDLLALTLKFGKVFYWLDVLSFLVMSRFKINLEKGEVLYTRDFITTLFFSRKKFIILEIHSIPKSKFLFDLSLKKARLFVVINSSLKNILVGLGVPGEKILISPSGVDLSQFNNSPDDLEIKGISKSDFIYGYIGSLKTMGMEKGVIDGLKALTLLPPDCKFLVVGGEKEDVEYYKNISNKLGVSDRVIFIGQVSYSDISKYASRCDVFVAPFPENEHYNFYMSPLKIFEYMASKRPIITTDLPSLKEILVNGENAILIPPSNPKALADAIIKIK